MRPETRHGRPWSGGRGVRQLRSRAARDRCLSALGVPRSYQDVVFWIARRRWSGRIRRQDVACHHLDLHKPDLVGQDGYDRYVLGHLNRRC